MAMDFKLSDEFVDSYRDKEPPFGYRDGAGNSLGEITYLRTYSRKKEDGTKETWADTCRRVIEGMFTIQKRHCRQNHIEWKNDKAQRTAKDAFDRMFNMKWLPAGRGIWAMGSPIVMEQGNSAPLQNCAFTTTEESIIGAMTFLFDASMLGIGVGFDARGANKFQVSRPEGEPEKWVIPDSREGWVESLEKLMGSFIDEGKKRNPLPIFDYSEIRPEGAEIKTFGGTASGPEPLKKIHTTIQGILEKRIGSPLSMTDIVDIGNLIGTAVVAGSTRRSAEIFFVDRASDDLEDFLNLKNPEVMPERAAWSWMSNNSITAKVGDDLSPLMEGIKLNGEPGIIWPDVAKTYGRIKDGVNTKDSRIIATNPCGEIFLEDKELCNLVEVFLPNVDDHEDYIKTLKVAYLYGKTVTLLPTKWEATNTVMQRNRRIGLSISGVADYVDRHGMAQLRQEFDDGYDYLAKLDTKYSEWLCIRESIRRTTQKPSGSVSILAGTSPGTHWTPGGEFFIRRITFSKSNPLFTELVEAGYDYETLDHDPTNAVILFPIHSKSRRSSSDVPAWEKIHLAAEVQAWWADNGVSCTVDFKPEEAKDIPTLLSMYDGKLKGISFLPAIEGGAYKNMPYEKISEETFDSMSQGLKKVNFSVAYSDEAEDAVGEKYCTTDVCEINEELNSDQEKVSVPMIDLLKV